MKTSRTIFNSGATLIELITAMSILLVILLMLSTALDASLGQFRQSTDRTAKRTSARAALQWLERDLETVLLPRPARLSPLPDSATTAQREFFESRLFYPTEINRSQHSGDKQSLPNASDKFDRLCFVSQIPGTPQLDPALNSNTRRADPAPSIVGYYVAYTRNSPLKGDTLASMKLFRHFRPGSSVSGQRYANEFLSYCATEINSRSELGQPLSAPNSAAVRKGLFSNTELPSLLGMRLPNDPSASPEESDAAWPVFPLTNYLTEPPPALNPNRGNLNDWENPDHSVHHTVFPDESLCRNVVRFEVRPERRVETSPGVFETLEASEINTHLGLSNGDEWPCLVVPDYLYITVGVINEATARTLTRYEDWLVDWKITDPSDWSETRTKIERSLQTFQLKVKLRRAAT
ncbi:MAG: hypothetical protein P1U68_01790 [Verrucomicrobiales bacterium]|nr:hypothetical protein [Verrucomicrobiales bacterium]